MTPRTRQILTGLIVAAVTTALAMVIYSTFRRVLEPADPERVAANAAGLESPTTTGEVVGTGADQGDGVDQQGDQGDGDGDGDEQTSQVPEEGGQAPPGGCQEPEPRNAQGTVVRLFFTCGTGPVPDVSGNAYRIVPATERRLTATLTELVQGPDAEERQIGFTSVFSDDTSGIFAGVVIDDGTAIVDFTGLESIEGLDQPTVANAMLATLNATVFQFDTVGAVEYRVGGSCQTFWATMGSDCITTSRQDWNRQLAALESGD